MKKLAIVIPCYNEQQRLKKSSILELINHQEKVEVYLVNDGSTDRTLEFITDLSKNHEGISVINYSKNQGKAKTIYKSFLELSKLKKITHFGYLDADFSTESKDFLKMHQVLLNSDKEYIFGSRILTLNTQIYRKTYRHFIGRIIITFINFFFKLGIYDTQCGAKIFNRRILNSIIEKEFVTNWLFDIEIFIRLSNVKLLDVGFEYPLQKWRDVNGSKIKKIDSLYIVLDIFKLIRSYR